MKHTLSQSKQDLLGQYNTENVEEILKNFKHLCKNRKIVDPFVGEWHLLDWAKDNGATSLRGFDIEKLQQRTQLNDYFLTPIQIEESELVITNPPYLSSNRNKNGDKVPYVKFKQNDYYKCYLATLKETNTEEAVIIIPTNFFCETSKKAREVLFKDYTVVYGEYWTQSVFKGVNISICAIHVKKSKQKEHKFTMVERPSGFRVEMEISKFGDYRHGKEFFEFIDKVEPIKFNKTNIGEPAPNTNIIVSLLDKGKYGLGLTYNEGEPIYCNPKSFTTYQITSPIEISKDDQKRIVKEVNEKMKYFREKYRSFFLGYFIDAEQKILSRTFINKMITKIAHN